MDFKQFKKLVSELYALDKEREAYIRSIPSDINAAFFDNTYTRTSGMQFDLVMQALFGDIYEDVCWFLYDCKFTGPNQIIVDKREYEIKSLEDYFDYAEKELF